MPQAFPVFRGEVSKGKLLLNDRPLFDRFLLTLQGAVEVIVKTPAKSRSTQQNRYLFGCVYVFIADYTGMTVDETHDAMKMLHLKKTVEKNGVTIETIGSTAKLDTREFAEYIERVRVFAALELGLYIPDANEYETNTTKA